MYESELVSELSNEAKYLGVILDTKPNWSKHSEHIINKRKRALSEEELTLSLKPHIIYCAYKIVRDLCLPMELYDGGQKYDYIIRKL